jgi:exonuclease III
MTDNATSISLSGCRVSAAKTLPRTVLFCVCLCLITQEGFTENPLTDRRAGRRFFTERQRLIEEVYTPEQQAWIEESQRRRQEFLETLNGLTAEQRQERMQAFNAGERERWKKEMDLSAAEQEKIRQRIARRSNERSRPNRKRTQ